MKTDASVDWWRVYGQYFGYPPCCIDSFCAWRHMTPEGKDGLQFRMSKHGFVPCMECALKIEIGEKTAEGLISNRAHFDKFPSDKRATHEIVAAWYESIGAS